MPSIKIAPLGSSAELPLLPPFIYVVIHLNDSTPSVVVTHKMGLPIPVYYLPTYTYIFRTHTHAHTQITHAHRDVHTDLQVPPTPRHVYL